MKCSFPLTVLLSDMLRLPRDHLLLKGTKITVQKKHFALLGVHKSICSGSKIFFFIRSMGGAATD